MKQITVHMHVEEFFCRFLWIMMKVVRMMRWVIFAEFMLIKIKDFDWHILMTTACLSSIPQKNSNKTSPKKFIHP